MSNICVVKGMGMGPTGQNALVLQALICYNNIVYIGEDMLIEAHGGRLINRILTDELRNKALKEAKGFARIALSEEDIKDVKNIARGVYSPLSGFLSKDDFDSVVQDMRLSNGTIWPIPITLDVTKEKADNLKEGKSILLTDNDSNPIAILELEQKFGYNKDKVANNVFGTTNQSHPGVKAVYAMNEVLLGGKISLIDNTKEPFYKHNLEPKETRFLFNAKGWKTVVAFQTRNAPHLGHEHLQRCGLEVADGLFINPVIGKKKPGDFKDDIILRSYEVLIDSYYSRQNVVLSILPMRMRYAGPREAVFHAIIRKNFGCTHFIVGRDHAGVGKFYGTYDAQNIFNEIEDELGIKALKFENSFYCKKCRSMATSKTCSHDGPFKVNISGTKIREAILQKKELEENFMRPEVIKFLKETPEPYVK